LEHGLVILQTAAHEIAAQYGTLKAPYQGCQEEAYRDSRQRTPAKWWERPILHFNKTLNTSRDVQDVTPLTNIAIVETILNRKLNSKQKSLIAAATMNLMLFLDTIHRNEMLFMVAALLVLFFAVPLWVALRIRRRSPPPTEEAPDTRDAQRQEGSSRDLLWLLATILELAQALILVFALVEVLDKILKLAN
jgi:hypothetical protein